jgi:hypothetical protein
MNDPTRVTLGRLLEQHDDTARQILGLPADAPLPPRAGVTLAADPLDRPAEPDVTSQENRS